MSQQIIIQNISEDKISLKVNGEVQEIQSQLEELKALIQAQKSDSVQYADQIINIENLNEANFGLLSGQRNFNEVLLEKLTHAITPYSKNAKILIDHAQKKKVTDWMHQKKYVAKAKKFIAEAYTGVLGMKLMQLMAIGSDTDKSMELKISPYIDKCIGIARTSFELLIFCLISKLWDYTHEAHSSLQLEADESAAIQEFFSRQVEPDLPQQFTLLKVLYGIFSSQKIPLPLAEMKDFDRHLEENSSLSQSCLKLQALYTDSRKNDVIECAEAEVQLSELLRICNFLANYKMVSIKQVGYKYLRNHAPKYIHHYFKIEQEQAEGTARYYSADRIATDTVLLYQERYQAGINLFPFVIDYNVVHLSKGSQSNLYFYQCCNFSEDGVLDYASMQKDQDHIEEIKRIEIEASAEEEQAIPDDARLKALNINHILEQFGEAKKALLGTTAEEEDDDEFDNLFD